MATNHSEANQMMSGPKAAEFLGVSKKTIENWRQQGKGPRFVRLSRRAVRYRIADLLEFIQRKTVDHEIAPEAA
ncbi:helix-turn-helix domain-containing protein [bacterium]|jgi:predicted DNA-binding transcriptional regulator AlpA|nr:helix-turn-helix domain-containing protein [bacterium]